MAAHSAPPPPEDWFRLLGERSGDVAFTLTPGPTPAFGYLGPGVERLTGIPHADAVADPARLLAILAPASVERARQLLSGEGMPAGPEILEVRRPDGSAGFIEVFVAVTRDDAGLVVRLDGVLRDVTERVSAERGAALETSILGSIRDAVIAVDIDGRVVFWNTGAEALFQRSAESQLGTRLLDMFASASFAGIEPLVAAIRRTEPWSGDVRVTWPDGRTQHLELMSYPLPEGPTGPGRVHIFWDVADERAASGQLLRLATSLDQADDAIYTLDADGMVLTWNRGAERLTGIPAAEAIGRRGPLATPATQREEQRRRAFEGEKTAWEENVPLRCSDGSIIPVSMRSVPVRDDDGTVVALSVFAADDRPRLAAEQRHRFQEAILAAVDDAVIVVDTDEHVTFWGPSAERQFGVTAEEAMGRVVGEVVGIRVLQGSVAKARHVVDGGDTFRSDVEYTRPDGTTFIGEVTIVALDTGTGRPSRLAVVRDVTEIRAAVADSARLAAIVDSAPDLIVSGSVDGRLLTWNRGAEEMLGWTAEEMVGRTIGAFIDPESMPVAWEMRRRVIEGRDPAVRAQIIQVHKDGTRIPVWLSLGPVVDEAGRVVAVSAVAQDMRLRKALEDQVQQAQKLEAVARLARGIAVDYNNLLTAVTGYTHLIEPEIDPATTAGDAVRQILRAADRAADLTRSLLAFSRGGSRDPRDVAVDPIIAGLGPTLRRILPDDVEIRTDLRSEASATLDTTELELALVNLATNAAEAMPDGGALVIETSTVEISVAQAAARLGVEAGSYLRITVADTGVGMTPEVRTHVFEPFYTTKLPSEGKGLGLAMTFAYVEAAGGSIWIDSERGRGTTVEVLLPVVAAAVAAAPAVAAPAASAGGSEHVLLVEDDPLVRALATAVLRRGGYEVTAAADPREADAMDPGRFDVMLSDIVMPGLAGPALGARMRARRPDLRMAFMSGFAEPEVLAEIAGLSSQPLLPKPFSPAALLTVIRATLDTPAPGDGTGE